MKIYIYTLSDPLTKEVRYIGKTNNLKQRFYNHLTHAKKLKYKRHVCYWVNSLLKQDLFPILEVIEECEDSWIEREIFWINSYKEKGADLCNHTQGGEGRLGSRVFENENEIIELIITKLKNGESQDNIEKELKVYQGYIAFLRRKGVILPKSLKKGGYKSSHTAWNKGKKIGESKRKNKGKGYFYRKAVDKWFVTISIGKGKQKTLGVFETEQEAQYCVLEYRKTL